MALTIDMGFKGLKLSKVYASVGELTICQDKITMIFILTYRASPKDEVFTEQSFNTFYSLEGNNPHSQAYTYLKTLPEFVGCIDC